MQEEKNIPPTGVGTVSGNYAGFPEHGWEEDCRFFYDPAWRASERSRMDGARRKRLIQDRNVYERTSKEGESVGGSCTFSEEPDRPKPQF